MLVIALMLALLSHSVKSLIIPNQNTNPASPANDKGIALIARTDFPNVEAEPVGFLIPTSTQSSHFTAPSPLKNDAPASSTTIPNRSNSKESTRNVHSQHVESVSKLVRSQSTNPRLGATTTAPNSQTPETKTALAYDNSMSIPLPTTQNPPPIKSGSLFIEHNKGVFAGNTLGSSTSTTIPAHQTSGTQISLVDSSSTSLLSSTTALPELFRTNPHTEHNTSLPTAFLVAASMDNAIPVALVSVGFLTPTTTQSSQIAVPLPSSKNTPASSTITDDSIQKVIQMDPLLMSAKTSSTTPRIGATKSRQNPQTRGERTAHTYGTSTFVPSLAIDTRAGLVTVLPTIKSDEKLGDAHTNEQNLTPGSTNALSSGSSTTILDLQDSSAQPSLVSDSSTSLLPYATAPPVFSRTPPLLTLGKQIITANSLGQYNLFGQTLIPGDAITISGTTISLTSGAKNLVVGTSTAALGPYVTAGISSGANDTKVQLFQGSAPGARDGLWSSSMAMLVGIAVLLWL